MTPSDKPQLQSGVLVVQTDPAAGREADFHRWYDGVHIPEILATPGFVKGARFRRVDSAGTDAGDAWRSYLAIYEIEAENLTEAYGRLLDRMHSGQLSRSEVFSATSPYRSQLFERVFRLPGTP
jgi:hypothetical protein